MRILLIHPPSRLVCRDQTGDWPPVWAARASGVLKSAGFLDIGLLDTAAKPLSDRALRLVIGEDLPDLVVVNAAVGSAEDALRLVETVKSLHPAAVCLLHGALATLNPRRLLAETPSIDVVAQDQSYEVLVEVARSIERGRWLAERREIPGLAFAEGASAQPIVTITSPAVARARPAERPDWSLLDWNDYVYQPLNRRCAILDLGCGGDVRCSVCGQFKPSGKRANRDTDALVEDIAMLFHTYDVRFFRLNEAAPPPTRTEMVDLCQSLIARGLGTPVNWAITLGPAEVIEAETHLALYRKAGLLHVTIEPDYVVPAGEVATRAHPRADARKAIRILRDAGIVSELRFPLTLEPDSLTSVDEGLRLALDSKPDLVTWIIPEPAFAAKAPHGAHEAIECLNPRVCDHAGRAAAAPSLDRSLLLERVMAAHKRFRDELVVLTTVDDARGRYINQQLKATLEATFGPRPAGLGAIAYWDIDLNPIPSADPQAWLSPGTRTPRSAPVVGSPEKIAEMVELIPSPLTSREGGATLHPLAIVKLLEALRLSGLDRFIQRIFDAAGESAWPARPPAMPIDERRLARVHQALRAVLMPDLARQVLECAGRLTAHEILEARVSRRIQGLAALLPSAVSNFLLVYLFRRNIRRNSATIMGSGTFEAWAGQPSIFERRGNPLCAGVKSETPMCAFQSAVIGELFRVLVSRSVEVVETHCEACGDPCCRYVVAWGSATRQKKMFDRLGIDPNKSSIA